MTNYKEILRLHCRIRPCKDFASSGVSVSV